MYAFRRQIRIAISSLLLVSALSLAGAQDRTGAKISDDPNAQPAPEVHVATGAVLPWHFQDGTDGAVHTSKEFLNTILTKLRIDPTSEVKSLAAWQEANGEEWTDHRDGLPTPAQMLRVGKRLGVDWVIAGRARWHTRSIWISLGPKTKSDCIVDALVVDVKNQEVALDAKDVHMDDTAKEDALKALGAVFVSSLFTVVSGGPKTPHEQRAAQLAIAKALEPWIVKCMPKTIKIDPNSK